MHYFPSAPDLPPDSPAKIVAWARVPLAKAWKSPGLPQEWSPVLDCDPEAPRKPSNEGWLFVYHEGKIREFDRRRLEVVDGPERPA